MSKKLLLAAALFFPLISSAAISATFNATSTDKGAISPNAINGWNPWLSIQSTGTSTFSNGIDLSAGCFSVGGICVGGSTGSAFPFTPHVGYNATTTVIGFNGLFSTASSTFGSSLFLTNLSQGALYTGSLGLTQTTATGTVSNGAGISVSAGQSVFGSGLTITNTAPDQTVVLNAGDGIAVSSAYPSFTLFNPFAIATDTANFSQGNLTYLEQASGKTKLGSVATGTLSTSGALSFDANPVIIGASRSLSLNTSGTWSGNAGTATALAADGTNCSAGSYPLGVDASGNSQSCTAAGTGTVTSIATGVGLSGGTITTTGTLTNPYAIATSSTLFPVSGAVYVSQASGLTTIAAAATSTPSAGVGISLAGTGATIGSLQINNPNAIATSSSLFAVSGVAYVSKVSGMTTLASVATSSETCTSPLSCTAHDVLTGGGAITIQNADTSHTGALTSTDWNTFSGKLGSYDGWTHLAGSATTSGIGIGTTTPFSQLSVSTSTQTANTVSLFAVASTTNATLLNVLGSGNVGVGTTSPGTLFSVQGSANFTTGTSTILGNGLLSPRINTTATSTVAGLQIPTGGLSIGTLTGTTCLHQVNGVVFATASDCGTGAGSVTSITAGADLLAATNPITTSGTINAQVGTSSIPTIPSLSYWTSVGSASNPARLGSVGTSSLSAGTGITLSGTAGALVGGTSLTINGTDIYRIATTSDIAAPNLAYFTKTSGVTTLGSTATTSASCSGTVSCTGFTVIGASPITITGSASVSGWPFTTSDTNFGVSVQSTTTPEWFKAPASGIVSLMASSTSQFDNSTTTETTVKTKQYLSYLTAGLHYQGSDNSTQSTATSTLGGGTTGLSFSNSPAIVGGSASALSGTLVVGNGGTGTTTSTSGQAYYAGGAGVFQSVGTSSIANGTNITVTNGGSAFVLGAQPTINLSGVVAYANGGTGSTTAPQGQLLYGGATAYQSVATTSVTCSGTVSCSGFTVLGSSPITLTGSASGASGLATTSPTNGGELLYYSAIGAGSAKSVATTSIGCSGNITCTGFTALGAASTISFTGTLPIGSGGTGTTTAPSGQLLYGGGAGVYQSVGTSTLTASGPLTGSFTQVGSGGALGCTTAASGVAGCLSSTAFDIFNNKLGSYDAWTHALSGMSATTSAIGIGTTTPFSQLSVSSTTAGNAATSMFAVASNTNATLFNILGSGNVGVGTTSPGTLFSIQGSANFTTGTSTILGNGLLAPRVNATATSTFAGVQISTGGLAITNLTGTQCLHEVSGVVLGTGSDCSSGGGGSDPFTHAVVGSSATTSFIGIGSTTPFSQLSVSSTTAGNAATSLFAVASNTNATLFNILGNGNVGVGTTSPGTLFSVQGSANFTSGTSTILGNGLLSPRFNATATSSFAGIQISTGGLSLQTLLTCSGTKALTTDGSGNVVCGTISASATPGAASSTVQVNTNGTFGGFASFFANGTYVGIGTTTAVNTQPFAGVLTVASSTAPQTCIGDAIAGDSLFCERTISNAWFLSTTTTQGLATSTFAAFSIDKNGIPRFPSLGTTTVSSLAVDGNGVIAATSTVSVIATGSFPAANSLSITNIPAGYNHLIFVASAYSFDTSARQMLMRFSVDNGSTFNSTGAAYSGYLVASNLTTASSIGTLASGIDAVTIGLGTLASTTAYIYGYQGEGSVEINSRSMNQDTTNQYHSTAYYNGSDGSGKPINAIQLIVNNTGNFTAGTYTLYGVR